MRNNTLFEISWEVCNKIGGIYTVISSKLSAIHNHFGSYYVMGPYLDHSSDDIEFKEVPSEFEHALRPLEELGIKIHFGTWNVDNRTQVILVEWLDHSAYMNDIKTHLWERYRIDSLNSNWHDYDSALLWSWCCGIVIEHLTQSTQESVFVHAHEWMSGGAIFYLKSLQQDKYKTVFTTHATMLGRSIAGHGEALYSILEEIDPHQKAYELGVYTKHQTERALAHTAHSFTTVSHITGREAFHFYDKQPDVLLFNGFDNKTIPELEKLNEQHAQSKEQTMQWLSSLFQQFYELDLSNTTLMYTSGRNEVRNKGVDVLINSLGKLNTQLKEEHSEHTVICLFLIMIGEFEEVKEYSQPPLTTHALDSHNEILRLFKEHNLFNKKEDKIKVLLMPIEIDHDKGPLHRTYYEFTQGLDVGVFVSYYEPWGYTPLESISYAVPTLTSDLSGFGASIQSTCGEACPSVEVLKRQGKQDEEVVEQLLTYFNTLLNEDEKARLYRRCVAKWLALKYDWSDFVKNYLLAYQKAEQK